MQNKTLKNTIIILTVLIIGAGIYFGYTFYQSSKKEISNQTSTQGTNLGRVPFQTRTASGTDITIIDNTLDENIEDYPIDVEKAPIAVPKLVQLWNKPVSGFDFIVKDIEILPLETNLSTTSTSTKNTSPKKNIIKNQQFVYLWDRETGNIHQNLASTSDTERLTNFTSPKAEEVYFTDESSVLVRELDQNNININNSYLRIYKETATSTVFTAEKKNIYVNADQISVLKGTKKMFYFLKDTGQAFISNIDLSSVFRVLNTSITQWVPQYVNKTTLAITTKPSAYFKGYLFFVDNTGTQDNQYILGEKYALTTLVSPDGKKVLYSEIVNDLLQTSIYDIKTKKTLSLTQSTISDKCSWANDSKKIYCAIPQRLTSAPYPDVWYQGSTSFSDNIWSINPESGKFELEIYLQQQVPQSIGAYNIKVSNDGKYLLFQDKYTLNLWKYTF